MYPPKKTILKGREKIQQIYKTSHCVTLFKPFQISNCFLSQILQANILYIWKPVLKSTWSQNH